MNQWIRQSEDGSIAGKLVLPQVGGAALAVSPATVGLVNERKEMKTVRTNEDGAFRFEGVEPGVYSLISRGANDVCSAIALHVVSHADGQAVALPQAVEVAAGQVEFASINSMMIRYLPPASLTSDAVATLDIDFKTLAQQLTTGGAHRIAQTNGGLVGRVYSAGAVGNHLAPSSQTNIFIFHDGEEIDRVVSDSSGAFEIEALPPAIYSAVFVGASGMAVVGFELVSDQDRGYTTLSGETSLVQAQDSGIASQLVMQVAPGDDVADGFEELGPVPGDVVIDEVVVDETVVDAGFGAPVGGGGFAGGGGFGGGGGAGGGLGGGGIGGLLGIAGLAAGVVAIANSDDDAVPPAATPAAL